MRPSNFAPVKWRKAEDEKPESGTEVLVVGLGRGGCTWFEVLSWRDAGEDAVGYWMHDHDIWEGYDVIWWTDLPKPPKIEVVP
jgi:hypothetical protein